MQPPPQLWIALDRKETERRVGRPVDLHDLAVRSSYARTARRRLAFPLARARHMIHVKPRCPQRCDILHACAGYLGGDVVKDVEVAREARRVRGRIDDHATGEVTLLRPVRRENRKDVYLEGRERHRVRSCAAAHAR